ncbi:hypothetical protein GQ53DRAFT_122624 [Thozetella sp. PMI_491]|nr:hypothetical protein GQ53DRAFT_122624 [Thozetella sp. PMI_491]
MHPGHGRAVPPAARHVKCDETHPICGQCADAGMKCDLPPPPQKVLDISKSLLSVVASASSVRDARELRALQYFMECAAPMLSGLFGRDFWQGLLLQVTYTEPAIHHAVVALSTWYEMFCSRPPAALELQPRSDDDGGIFALCQYTMSLNRLGLLKSTDELEMNVVCLTSCLIYLALEVNDTHFPAYSYSPT